MKKLIHTRNIEASRFESITSAKQTYTIDVGGFEQYNQEGSNATNALKRWLNSDGTSEHFEEYLEDDSYIVVYDSNGDICDVNSKSIRSYVRKLLKEYEDNIPEEDNSHQVTILHHDTSGWQPIKQNLIQYNNTVQAYTMWKYGDEDKYMCIVGPTYFCTPTRNTEHADLVAGPFYSYDEAKAQLDSIPAVRVVV